MRRTALTCLGFATLALGVIGASTPACTASSSSAPLTSEHVIRTAQPIEGGTVNQTDTAVVGILIGSNGQLNSLCSGSLIGPNLVLSAHHCVATPPNNLVCGGKFSTTITAASDFAITTSYDAAEQIWVSSNPAMPTINGVTWWGVSKVDVPTTNNVCSADQSLLTLSSSITGVCPLIPAVDVLPTDGEAYTAIGFGITSPNGQTAGTRYKLASGLSVQCVGSADCNDNTIGATGEWEGGSSAQEGTCEGDSGGPALDSLNRILGTVSRGPSNACNSTVYESTYDYTASPTTNGAWIKQIAQEAATTGGYTVAGWVTGTATSAPGAGYPCTSSSSSSSSSSTSTSSSTSSSGGGSVPTTCAGADGVEGCCVGNVNYYCGTGQTTVLTETCPANKVCGWNASKGYYGCVAPPATSDPSNTYPLACPGSSSSSSSTSTTSTSTSSSSSSSTTSTSGTSTSSSTSSSSGSNACTGQTPTGVPACDTCIDNSCCTEYVNCANDATCVSCEGSASPPASCNSDAAFTAFNNCVAGPCGSACAASSSSSSSGTTSSGAGGGGTGNSGTGNTGTGNSGTGGGSSSGNASSSSGTFGVGGGGNGGSGTGNGNGNGGAGNGNTGTGAGYGLGNNPGSSSGCNVASSGGAPASPASLAGLLLGAALIVSRRRR